MQYHLWVDHNTVNTIKGIVEKDNSPENMQELREWYEDAKMCTMCTQDYSIFNREMKILNEVERLIF